MKVFKIVEEKIGERRFLGILFLFIDFVVMAALAAMFSLIPDDPFLEVFPFAFKLMMTWFGAPFVISSVLLFITKKLDDDEVYKYSCGWYYSTLFVCYALFRGYESIPFNYSFAISGLITFLVCVIIHQRTNR